MVIDLNLNYLHTILLFYIIFIGYYFISKAHERGNERKSIHYYLQGSFFENQLCSKTKAH
jgi:hypothetical protein